MGVCLEKANYYGWDGYKLSVGDIELGIAPQIGGRIISLKFQGEELFFVQGKHQGEVNDLSKIRDLRAFKRSFGHRLWGGDKTWISPQSAWWEAVPPLDLDAGQYSCSIEDSAIVMESPICRETGLRITRRVDLSESGVISLVQTIRNMSDREIKRGIWNVTQILRPFDVYLPCRIDSIRAYSAEGESESLMPIVVQAEEDWAKIICRDALHFKYGGLIEQGLMTVLRREPKSTLAFLCTFEIDPHAQYAHEALVEVFNSSKYNYLELEIHAPLMPLPPGDSVTHHQKWRIGRFKEDITPNEAVKILTTE